MSSFQIPENYIYAVGVCGYIGLVQFGIGAASMGYRKFFKSKAFLEKTEVKELQELHKKAFGTNFNADGYPDTGNGRYSQLLDYEEWVQFNNGQRAHFNMIESSGPTLACVLGVGLYYPITASVLGFIYGTGRVVYTIGYLSNSGADARIAGALLGLIGNFGLYFTALSIPIRNKLM